MLNDISFQMHDIIVQGIIPLPLSFQLPLFHHHNWRIRFLYRAFSEPMASQAGSI